jgi:hypothetical protein
MITFTIYLTEELSDADIKKIKKVGIETAKEVFDDKYDEAKATKLIDDVISKNKNKSADDVSAIVQNSFRAE